MPFAEQRGSALTLRQGPRKPPPHSPFTVSPGLLRLHLAGGAKDHSSSHRPGRGTEFSAETGSLPRHLLAQVASAGAPTITPVRCLCLPRGP